MIKSRDLNRQPSAVSKPNKGNITPQGTLNTASKAPNPAPNKQPLDSIIFDWGHEERWERYLKDVHLLRIQKPWLDYTKYTFRQWVEDALFDAQMASMNNLTDDEFEAREAKAEMVAKAFFYKSPFIDFSGYCIGVHPWQVVPYPLPYGNNTFTNDRRSNELLKKIYNGFPTIHRILFSSCHPQRVLDLGCGDGSWIIDAAQCWPDTHFYGIDVQKLWPTAEDLTKEYGDKLARNIKFIPFNFLLDKLPFLDNVFDLVRLANLKWCIRRADWDVLMKDVHRVLTCAGYAEVIDDDFITYTDHESTKKMTLEDQIACETLETRFLTFLAERHLPLDTHKFMVEKLKIGNSAVHQDVFPIGISNETKPNRTKQDKKGKRRSDRISVGGRESGPSLSRIMSRVRLNSVASSSSLGLDSEKVDVERPLPPKPHPVGLVLPTLNRTLELTNEEIIAHATKNMQDVLSATVVMQKDMELKDPRILLPSDKCKKIPSEWEELLNTYDRTMSDRLNINISRCGFDSDSDDDTEVEEIKRPRKKERISLISTFAGNKKAVEEVSPWAGNQEFIAREMAKQYGVDKLVRVIRVYTMMK